MFGPVKHMNNTRIVEPPDRWELGFVTACEGGVSQARLLSQLILQGAISAEVPSCARSSVAPDPTSGDSQPSTVDAQWGQRWPQPMLRRAACPSVRSKCALLVSQRRRRRRQRSGKFQRREMCRQRRVRIGETALVRRGRSAVRVGAQTVRTPATGRIHLSQTMR